MKPSAPNNDSFSGKISSALKALAILEGVAARKKPIAASELASVLGVPKPTAHRIAISLERENYLQREPGTRGFVSGSRLIALALDTLDASFLQGPRHAILKALSDEVGETCNLGVISGSEVVYIERVESAWPLGLRFQPGSRVPLHCTAIGKLLLGFLPQKKRELFIHHVPLRRYTKNTITDPEKLAGELERIRAEGVSVDNEEFLQGVVCMAVPVAGLRRRIYTGLAISAPVARVSQEQVYDYLPALQESAAHLSALFTKEDGLG